MTIVLVHGVPETDALWRPLRQHLDRSDVVALQLPGFGCPRPDGFASTKEEYVAWLVGELEVLAQQGPVDLMGHDWGSGLTARVVSTRPELVRSWAADTTGFGDPDFEWHDFAKIWQTPGAGEDFFAPLLVTPPNERGAIFESFGVPTDSAIEMGSWLDETMVDSILRLYRSAVDVATEWSLDFVDIPAPGLVIIASDDPFTSEANAKVAAQRAGAQVVEFDGLGHWWMLQDPARGAAALQEFWSSVE